MIKGLVLAVLMSLVAIFLGTFTADVIRNPDGFKIFLLAIGFLVAVVSLFRIFDAPLTEL